MEQVLNCTGAVDAATTGARLARRLGKSPVAANALPGVAASGPPYPMLNDAVLAYACSIASAADIDEAMKLGRNQPIGPLALCDLIGLDVVLAAMDELHREFDDDTYLSAPLLQAMVAAGHLGRKAGRGFFTY